MEASREWVEETLADLCQAIGCLKPRICWASYSNSFFDGTAEVTFKPDPFWLAPLGKPKPGKLFLNPKILRRREYQIPYVLAKHLVMLSPQRRRRATNVNLLLIALASIPIWLVPYEPTLRSLTLKIQPILLCGLYSHIFNSISAMRLRTLAIQVTGQIQPAIDEIHAEAEDLHGEDESKRLALIHREVATLKRQLVRSRILLSAESAKCLEDALGEA